MLHVWPTQLSSCYVSSFPICLCRDVSHRWFRSAVVKPMLRAEETEPLRAMTCAVLLHACALLYGFNYRLWTQTDLFILLHSIHWGLVGTTNTRATHTQTHALTHTALFYSEQVVPASWVTHLCFMSNNSVICGYLSAGHHRKQALKCSSFHHCMTNCSHLFLLFRL